MGKGSWGISHYSDAFSSIKLHQYSQFKCTHTQKFKKILITEHRILHFFFARSSIQHFMNSVIFVFLHVPIWSRLQAPHVAEWSVGWFLDSNENVHCYYIIYNVYTKSMRQKNENPQKKCISFFFFVCQMDSNAHAKRKIPAECLYSVTSSGIR